MTKRRRTKPKHVKKTKECTECKQVKDRSEFHRAGVYDPGKQRIRSICKTCFGKCYNGRYKEYQQQWYKRNKRRVQNYQEENRKKYLEYERQKQKDNRMQVLSIIGRGKVECIRCGCCIAKFLEINRINGGGRKEILEKKVFGSTRMLLKALKNGTRKIDDLNILCRPCNSLDYLERMFGLTGHKITWKFQ